MQPFTDETTTDAWHGKDRDLHSGLSNAQIGVLSITLHFAMKGESIQGNICITGNNQCVSLHRNNVI